MKRKTRNNFSYVAITFLLFFLIGCSSLETAKNVFIGVPFVTENGEKLNFPLTPVEQEFKWQESEHFRITNFKILSIDNRKWAWSYGFDIKDESIELEYVKIYNILPNKEYQMIYDNKSMKASLNKYGLTEDIVLENGATTRINKANIKIDEVTTKRNSWYGQTSSYDKDEEFKRTLKEFNRNLVGEENFYLSKFIIKAKGYEPEIIYQPAKLPVSTFGAYPKP